MKKFFVEYAQNYPAIVAVLLATTIVINVQASNKYLIAIGILLVGSILSATLIEATDQIKAPDHVASWKSCLVNIAVFSVASIIFVAIVALTVQIFPQQWGIYLTCAVVIIAFIGGCMQGYGSKQPSLALVHGVALAAGALFAFLPLKPLVQTGSYILILVGAAGINLFSVYQSILLTTLCSLLAKIQAGSLSTCLSHYLAIDLTVRRMRTW